MTAYEVRISDWSSDLCSSDLLERFGVGSRLVSFDANAFSTYAGLDLRGVRVICLSYMNAGSLAHARYLVRRLRRRTDARILIGLWSLDPEEAAGLDLVKLTRAALAATSLGRSEERRVGKECVSTGRSRWSPCH